MKNNKLIFLLLIIGAGIAAWLMLRNESGSIDEALRDFAVKDTGAVTKIFMADKSGNQVLLERQNAEDWLLNGKLTARPDAIKTLLTTIYQLEVRSPIGKNAYNNVIKGIASKGIKVEIYTDKGLLKTFYVGGPTQDQMGTFMYLENSTTPFVIHIPGFDGYLTPRFIVKPGDWTIKNVFRLKKGELKTLKVTDREKENGIFTIEADGSGNYTLFDEKGNALSNVSQDKIVSYLEFYQLLNYEMDERSLKPHQKDSLTAQVPFRRIEMTKADGTTKSIDIWRRPQTSTTVNKTNEAGQPYPFDIDRMTARIDSDTNLVLVQYFSFEKLFRKTSDFMNSPVQK